MGSPGRLCLRISAPVSIMFVFAVLAAAPITAQVATSGGVSKQEPAKRDRVVVLTDADLPPPVVDDGPERLGEAGYIGLGDPVLDEAILREAKRTRVDPLLLRAVARQESRYNYRARSPKGAVGVMQLMPATQRRFNVKNPYDPAESVRGGAEYLRFLLDRYDQDVVLALAGYNAGEGAVDLYGRRVPPFRETQGYVKAIAGAYKLLVEQGKQRVAAEKAAERELQLATRPRRVGNGRGSESSGGGASRSGKGGEAIEVRRF